MSKKIIVTGATGFIGTKLCSALIERGDELTVFTRNATNASGIIPGAKDYIEWDYHKPEQWIKFIEGKDSIIHLSGASITGRRWNEQYKQKILESRKLSTKNLVDAAGSLKEKPSSFISASATGYYGDKGDIILTEESGIGNDFLAQVCKDWENASKSADDLRIRRVNIRTGIALGTEAGALRQFLLPFKLFIGGPLGRGNQWFPWIHIDDLVRIFIYSLDNNLIKGAVNAVSPNPVTMTDFARSLGKALNRPSFFPAPKFVLKLAIGEAADSITASQRAMPEKLLNSGFKFKYENINEALNDLILENNAPPEGDQKVKLNEQIFKH